MKVKPATSAGVMHAVLNHREGHGHFHEDEGLRRERIESDEPSVIENQHLGAWQLIQSIWTRSPWCAIGADLHAAWAGEGSVCGVPEGGHFTPVREPACSP